MSKATELKKLLDADTWPGDMTIGKWANEAISNMRRLEKINAELLEALQELLSEVSEGITTSPLTRNKAQAAIAKATGTS